MKRKKRHPRPKEETQDREDRLNEGIKRLGIYPKGSGDSVKDFKYRDNMINKG